MYIVLTVGRQSFDAGDGSNYDVSVEPFDELRRALVFMRQETRYESALRVKIIDANAQVVASEDGSFATREELVASYNCGGEDL